MTKKQDTPNVPERRLCACGHLVRVDLWIGHRLKCEHVRR